MYNSEINEKKKEIEIDINKSIDTKRMSQKQKELFYKLAKKSNNLNFI